jgi:CTP synthase
VDVGHVIESRDVETIYEVPLRYREQHLDDHILDLLGLEAPEPDLSDWVAMVDRIKRPEQGSVRIAVVGKYTALIDAYKSIAEALVHGGIANDVGVEIDWVSSEELEDRGSSFLDGYGGVLIPGGFGVRGTDGMVDAVRFARESGLPFLGICLGLQCAIIEFARNVCGLEESHSHEFNRETTDPVISLMDAQYNVTEMGGTMRLGAYPCRLQDGSVARELYGASDVAERHRHRYEVNNEYREDLGKNGMRFSGLSPDGGLVEIVELPDHPFFLATQFHPELRSRPMSPHPLFTAFVAAADQRTRQRQRQGETPATRPEIDASEEAVGAAR